MIKNWNKFIKEGVEYDYIKKKLEYIIETPDSEYENGSKGKESDLISIFRNDLKIESSNAIHDNHIIKTLNLYNEYIYNELSKEINDFLINFFGNIDRWIDIREYVDKLSKKIKELLKNTQDPKKQEI